jgi:hypothetical protein
MAGRVERKIGKSAKRNGHFAGQRAPAARTPDGRWMKGVSASPAGLSRDFAQRLQKSRELLMSYDEEAIQTVVHWMRDRKWATNSLAAAFAILNRNHGKPEIRQTVQTRSSPQLVVHQIAALVDNRRVLDVTPLKDEDA